MVGDGRKGRDTAVARGTIKHYTSDNSSSSQTLASRPRPNNNKPRARPTGVRPTNQTPPLPRLCFRGNGTTKSLPPGNDSLLLHLPLSPPAMSSDEDRMLGVVGWWRTSGERQTDLLELQKECQSAEKRHQLDVNQLNQEVQQTRLEHYTLQAQSEKVTLQKQALERDIDALKEKVKWTEGELKESQKKEAQTQTKLTESLCEREGLNVTLEQNRRRETGLEEEVKKLAEELAEAFGCIKELEDQKTVQPTATPMAPVPFSPAGQSFAPVSQPRHGHTTPRTSSAQTNRPARGEQAREEREERERGTESKVPHRARAWRGHRLRAHHSVWIHRL
ncbi:uncharacterized protein ACWYII_025574 [Salvelinus alpinus]|uniref:M protein, serotype 24-like n=1 Tax=Salvelinus alpinus TaxID=8036 RepID=UPI0039FCD6B3